MIRNHVLVVEDDPAMQDLYKTFFTVAHKDEFVYRLAEDGEKALRWLQCRPFDLIVLDRELPDMGGLDVLRWVRENRSSRLVSVLIVSGRSGMNQRVEGLNLGADDYLCKPFANEELLAKLRALVRQRERWLDEKCVRDIGWLKVDPTNRIVRIDNRSVRLNRKELSLLLVFVRRPNVVHPSKYLWEMGWGNEKPYSEHILGNRISSLRKKFGRRNQCLVSHKGIGYSFETKLLIGRTPAAA